MPRQREIKQGDTLSEIAQDEGVGMQSIIEANQESEALPDPSNPDRIIAGQTLNIPDVEQEQANQGNEPSPDTMSKPGVGTTANQDRQERMDTDGPEVPEGQRQESPAGQGDVSDPVDGESARRGAASETPPTPDPTADSVRNEFVKGLQNRLQNRREALKERIESERNRISDEKEDVKDRIDKLEGTQEDVIEDIGDVTSPFREDLEEKERERLKVEENFFKNQELVNEMDTLLTSMQEQVQQAESVTGLSGVREPRIQKIKEDITARVGVIESVLAARNNQISVAQNMIDRTVEAVTADRQDQLNYYETLLSYAEKEESEERDKLLDLKEEDKKFLSEEVDILRNDLDRARESADMIKDMMLDPEQASVIGEAGIKLNDSPQEIQRKLSQYSYSQEVIETNNEMEKDGYQKLNTQRQINNKPEDEIVRLQDSKGNEHVYWKPGGADGEEETDLTVGDEDMVNTLNEIQNESGQVDMNEFFTRMKEEGKDKDTAVSFFNQATEGVSITDIRSTADSIYGTEDQLAEDETTNERVYKLVENLGNKNPNLTFDEATERIDNLDISDRLKTTAKEAAFLIFTDESRFAPGFLSGVREAVGGGTSREELQEKFGLTEEIDITEEDEENNQE